MAQTTLYTTDVLVVGGGGAGITAAVAAARSGVQVLLVSKGQPGNSGNTIMIGGSYAMDGDSAHNIYGVEAADPTFTKEILYQSIVCDGFFLSDQNMVEQFVEESPAIVWEVFQWSQQTGKPFAFGPPATWAMSGNMMGRALRYGLEHTPNIDILEDVMIVELLKSGDRVCGAMGIRILDGELIEIHAKAVVLGTGGFQPFSFKNTNSDMTGDGPAMAFRAGARLADMEFLLFLLSAIEPVHMKGSILPLMVATNPNFRYRAVDGNGKEMPVPPKLKELETKSEICKLVDLVYYGEVCQFGPTGPGGGFFMETLNTPEELDLVCRETEEMFAGFYKKGYYHGEEIKEAFDLLKRTGRWECGLSNEYLVGGIYVDEKMRTTLPGLFAGGETASGVFGACRVADAVTEMVVQGYRAGISAAESCAGIKLSSPDHVDAVAASLLEVFDHTAGGPSPMSLILEMEAAADRGIGCVREEKSIRQAIADFEVIEAKLPTVSIGSKSRAYNYEWIQYFQLRNRLTCSKLAAMMADIRKESRGLHIRSDYPSIDNETQLLRTFAERNGEGSISFSRRPPIAGKVPLPPPGIIDYRDYLMTADLGLENLAYMEGL